MTGNQYFIVILAGILAYFVVSMAGLYVRNKEVSDRIERIARFDEQSAKLHRDNMKLLEIIKESINGKS